MTKWAGNIGFAETVEVRPGVWKEGITDRKYYGELVKNYRRIESNNQANNNVDISNQLSIVSDPYANENFFAIRYAEFMGAKWVVSSVEVNYPRLTLSLGGLYNVEQT